MSATKYDIDVDLGAEGTSHRYMVEMVGSNKNVLDVGCATGYLAKTLRAFGNTVTGLEYDPEAAERARQFADKVIVADLDHINLTQALAGETFDVIVFGDVLEHLRDPLPPLRQARSLLAPGGYIVISIPNVAHGDVRMSLLLGRFTYRNLGLLDSTHLRFFTRQNLIELLEDAGLVAVEVRPTKAPLFGTELGVRPDEVDPAVVEMISADPDALVYQFVCTAVPHDATTLAADAAWRLQCAETELAQAQTALLEQRVLCERHQAELAEMNEHAVWDAAGARQRLVALEGTRTLRLRASALRLLRR
jgi:2-polyprenyl-3-methyl-5-hydroxy-6-metoxy-1,4-benzoquinol methylase